MKFYDNTPEDLLMANNAMLQTIMHNQAEMFAWLNQILTAANLIVPNTLTEALKYADVQKDGRDKYQVQYYNRSKAMAEMNYLKLKFNDYEDI